MVLRLRKIHHGHQGIQRWFQRIAWWLCVAKDIEEFIKTCRPECLQTTPPQEWVASYLLELRGATYLLVVDYYPNMRGPKTSFNYICQCGYSSEIHLFLSWHTICVHEWQWTTGFTHITSSPYSNGFVERTVKTVKNLLNNCTDAYMALVTLARIHENRCWTAVVTSCGVYVWKEQYDYVITNLHLKYRN